jgi:hypothetical protein
VSVDWASVFRVLTTLFGVTAVGAVVAGVAGVGGDTVDPFLLALVSAVLSLSFRLAARAAGGPSPDRVSLVGSWLILIVLGSVLVFLLLFVWAIDDAFGRP